MRLKLTLATRSGLVKKVARSVKIWQKAKQVDMRSTAEHVANIRDVFAINMSDLASILGVARPTVYAWLSGQEPKAEAVIIIQRLSHAADKFSQANIPRLDQLIYRPILNGRSLLDTLKSGEDPVRVLASLKAVADKEAQTRCEPKGAGKHLRSLVDVLGESSAANCDRPGAAALNELTVQEAADLINVSLAFLVKQMEAGEIPFTRSGGYRQIKPQDLMDYKERIDRLRDAALDELAEIGQELERSGTTRPLQGLYVQGAATDRP